MSLDIYDTYYIYYIETNIICILLLSFILVAYSKEMRGAAETIYYNAVIMETIMYCLADMLTAVFRGQYLPGARLILWLSNAIYIAFPALLVVTWGQYIVIHMKKYGFQKSVFDRIFRFLVIAGFVITLSSPVTHFAFYLDAGNIYHRNPGAYVVPILSYVYMIYDTGRILVLGRKIDSLEGRREAKTFSIFIIPCFLFSLVQMFVYGCTTAQVGFTIGFIIVYIIGQQNKISKDALTGLNNRREFENQFDNMAKNAEKLLVGMIDIDFFKSINDTYGHVEGDQAIKKISLVLAKSCGACKNEGGFFLSRYGGDEFVILSKEFNEGADQALEEAIKSELAMVNEAKDTPYELHVSIGTACGPVTCREDAIAIMDKADSEMYREKKAKKKNPS